MRTGCFHLPSFSAWVFRQAPGDVPGTGRRAPVVVVQGGGVWACGARARRAGVTAGMAAERAATLLPGARLCPRDAALEQAAWEDVLHRLHGVTPFLESLRQGTALFRTGAPADVRRLAGRLGAQAAVAPGRAYARLAAVRAAPGHLLDVAPADLGGFLRHYPVDALSALGFCDEMLERLRLFGYGTLGAAASLSRRHLEAQFGEEGARLHGLLHPGDEPPVAHFHPPPSVAAGHTFDRPCTEPGDLLPALAHLVDEAADSLGPLHCRRVRVLLHVRGRPEPAAATRLLPEATAAPRRLLQTARTLLLDRLVTGEEVDRLALELGGLRRAAYRQPSLFFERPSVEAAVRAVQRRFPGALVRAVPVPHVLFDEEDARFEPLTAAAPAAESLPAGP